MSYHGTDVSRLSRRAWLLVVLLVAMSTVAGVSAAGASAAGAPRVRSLSINNGELYSTRTGLIALAFTNDSETNYRIEYSTSSSGPWTVACEASQPGTTEVENPDIRAGCLIRHLTPDTTYHAQFVAVNAFGEGHATTEFTTKPASAPEATITTAENSEHAPAVGVHFVEVQSDVEANGRETKYRFEYAALQAGPWSIVPGCSGVVAAEPFETASGFTEPKCRIEGLEPETRYYVRVVAENEKGALSEEIRHIQVVVGGPQEPGIMTRTARPGVGGCVACHSTNITPTSVTLHEFLTPNGSETRWRFEYATTEAGPWSSGGEGVIPASEADERDHTVAFDLTGLKPSTVYYVRLNAENEAGSEVCLTSGGATCGAPRPMSFETAGVPLAFAFSTHTFAPGASEAVRLLGSIRPDAEPSNEVQMVSLAGSPAGGSFALGIEGHTTVPISFDARETEVRNALENAADALPAFAGKRVSMYVSGPHGGPYRVEFMGAASGIDLPQMSCDASHLEPASATCAVATAQNGSSPHTRYHVEYIEQQRLEEAGWSAAEKGSEVDGGSGGVEIAYAASGQPQGLAFSSAPVALDLPLLTPGRTYRYRVVGSNQAGSAASQERSLSTPAAVTGSSGGEACANTQFRTGFSAQLPDCRAYEQVSPVDKEGAAEIEKYGGISTTPLFTVGADGEHLLFESPATKWGRSPDSFLSHYLMSRTSSGWALSSATPQPQAGLTSYVAHLDSPDLTHVGVEVGWKTSLLEAGAGINASHEIELAAGVVGGPYATATAMPRTDVPRLAGEGRAWVAASGDFSKLVLQSEDRKLLGTATGTVSGTDLYEYTGGALRQLNVNGSGTIGRCGAQMANGFEAYDAGEGARAKALSSPNAVSSDGSRVFFEAVPGGNCSMAKHLYIRVNGATTIDLGEDRFLGANPTGSAVLVEHVNGPAGEVFLYEVESGTTTHLLSGREPFEDGLTVAEDLGTFYFTSRQALTPESPTVETGLSDLYRYDVRAHTLEYVAQIRPSGGTAYGTSASPNGRYFYFTSAGVVGVPGGTTGAPQAYRYDSTTSTIQCVSCASPYDPEPRLLATYAAQYQGSVDGTPVKTIASANGDFVFFDTPSALVKQDINGEKAPSGRGENEYSNFTYSPSSDVYEWRREGVDGCAHAQGCLSLISSGQGGFFVELLGADASGRDVFFTSRSQLAPSDEDSALDVYDARIGGGFPPPHQPATECEGDACLSPQSAPIDTTPASSSFSGSGNLAPGPKVQSQARPRTRIKPCAKGRRGSKRRCVKRGAKHGKRIRRGRPARGAKHGKRIRRGRPAVATMHRGGQR